jgi:hypothetical protein
MRGQGRIRDDEGRRHRCAADAGPRDLGCDAQGLLLCLGVALDQVIERVCGSCTHACGVKFGAAQAGLARIDTCVTLSGAEVHVYVCDHTYTQRFDSDVETASVVVPCSEFCSLSW